MALIKLKERVIEAFAATRDIKKFPQLSEELSHQFAKNWAVGSFREATESLKRGSLDVIDIVVICVDKSDEENLSPILEFLKGVKERGAKTILIASDVGPAALHQLMRQGADDFIPYPFPDGAFNDSLTRLREAPEAPAANEAAEPVKRKGMVLPVYGMAGGVGATTFSVNLAWELANHDRKANTRVVILDFNFQSGSVATYLDIPRRDAVTELLTDSENINAETFAQALTSFKSRVAVMTAPPDTLPLDIIDGNAITNIISLAQEKYDFVIIDLPPLLAGWTSDVIHKCETFFTLISLDMRSAQNLMRFVRTLKAEDLPEDKLEFILNFAPSFTDINGKARTKRFSENLGIDVNILLPDGGKAVLASCDQGSPLAETAAKNALRKEIKKLAASLVDLTNEIKAAIV